MARPGFCCAASLVLAGRLAAPASADTDVTLEFDRRTFSVSTAWTEILHATSGSFQHVVESIRWPRSRRPR